MIGDDELLAQFVAGEPEAFVVFYRRHLAAILGFFLRRTRDAELTADLTAEVFAAALVAVRRYRPGEQPALAWLYGIAAHKLADSRRRGRVEDEARRRLALAPITIDDQDLARVEEMADAGAAQAALQSLPRYLPKIPQALRAPTTELQTGYIAWIRGVYNHGPRDAVCLVDIGGAENGSNCGIAAAQIKAGMDPQDDTGVFSGIVPDGVATVTLDFPATGTQPARTGSGPVVGMSTRSTSPERHAR